MPQEQQRWKVQFRNLPLYTVEINKVNVIECIKHFEAGGSNVYFVDENSHYTGMILPKSRFAYGWQHQAPMTVQCPSIEDVRLAGGAAFLASRSGNHLR